MSTRPLTSPALISLVSGRRPDEMADLFRAQCEMRVPIRVPVSYLPDLLRHEFGEYLVLGLNLRLQAIDRVLLG